MLIPTRTHFYLSESVDSFPLKSEAVIAVKEVSPSFCPGSVLFLYLVYPPNKDKD